MKKYLIPLIIMIIVIVGYFSISQITVLDQNESKQCIIPNRDELMGPRVGGGPNDGKPHFSLAEMFSIYSNIGISSIERLDDNHTLLISIMPNSYGHIVMCDPLPILQKMYYDNKINDLAILVDNEEIEYKIVENVLKLNVNNNTKIEIVGQEIAE